MSSTKITAPAEGFSGVGPAGLVFTDGVAETDDAAVVDYCRTAGYGIDGSKPRKPVDAEAPDPRTLEDGVVGTRLRDAAVDPRPEDFLPPTNAGKANPHGPLVVAPGIHGIESQVIRPGQVFVDDLQAQEAAETAQAVALLVENRQVGDAIATFVRGDEDGKGGSDTGPLGLSDPGSVVAIETGNAVDVEDATMPDGTSAELPAGNAGREAWATYAGTRGATDADLADLSRNQIRDMYAPTEA